MKLPGSVIVTQAYCKCSGFKSLLLCQCVASVQQDELASPVFFETEVTALHKDF